MRVSVCTCVRVCLCVYACERVCVSMRVWCVRGGGGRGSIVSHRAAHVIVVVHRVRCGGDGQGALEVALTLAQLPSSDSTGAGPLVIAPLPAAPAQGF